MAVDNQGNTIYNYCRDCGKLMLPGRKFCCMECVHGKPEETPLTDPLREALERIAHIPHGYQHEKIREIARVALASQPKGTRPLTEPELPPHSLRSLIERLERRILVKDGGKGDPWRDHWNLTENDSLLHKEAAAALSAPRPLVSEPPAGRDDAIAQAAATCLEFGFHNTNPPPDGHWLMPYWQRGRFLNDPARLSPAPSITPEPSAVPGEKPRG